VPFLLACVLLCLARAAAEEFAGEPFLEGSSVADNGTSGAIPSRLRTATQFLDFPGDFGEAKSFRLEMATLPLFGDLAQSWSGAAAYTLDSSTSLSLFGKLEITPDIESRPLLRGSREDRLNNPGFRPLPCDGCAMYTDNLYVAALNLMRAFRFDFPRLDIASRQIPMELGIGLTAKYYLEELTGPQEGDFFLSNLNLDAGAGLKLFWGWDPIAKRSDRDIKIQFSGLELLPTRQQSDIGGQISYEKMAYRWRMSADWEEGFPSWSSTLTAGFTQKSEGGDWPAFGAEWDYRKLLYVRAGRDDDFLSAGVSLAWRWFSVHYAFRRHELGNTWYQVSGQLAWP
jgi:hypothetical protein